MSLPTFIQLVVPSFKCIQAPAVVFSGGGLHPWRFLFSSLQALLIFFNRLPLVVCLVNFCVFFCKPALLGLGGNSYFMMGISGLLPFIKDASEAISVRKYKGQTVAVDTYCWLHKGAFSCADKLAKGEPTNRYVKRHEIPVFFIEKLIYTKNVYIAENCLCKFASFLNHFRYVSYCMKYVDMLLTFGVKPILVFDGCNLPSKEEVEKTRRE